MGIEEGEYKYSTERLFGEEGRKAVQSFYPDGKWWIRLRRRMDG